MPVLTASTERAPAEVSKSSLRRHRRKDSEQEVTAQSWRDLFQPHLGHPACLWGGTQAKTLEIQGTR